MSSGMDISFTFGHDKLSSILDPNEGRYFTRVSHSDSFNPHTEHMLLDFSEIFFIPLLRNPIWLRQPPFTGLSDRNVWYIRPLLGFAVNVPRIRVASLYEK